MPSGERARERGLARGSLALLAMTANGWSAPAWHNGKSCRLATMLALAFPAHRMPAYVTLRSWADRFAAARCFAGADVPACGAGAEVQLRRMRADGPPRAACQLRDLCRRA